MNGLKKSFFGLVILAAMGWISAPMAVGTALADNAAPAAAPSAPSTPAAKPVAKKAPAKKMAKKVAKKKAAKKMVHVPTFAGVIRHMDMNANPMTLVVIKGSGRSEFVFGGDLTGKTAVYKGKKKVGMSALKEGQKVVLHYRNIHGSVAISAIWIR